MERSESIRISGCGCGLLDEIYGDVDFGSAAFAGVRSQVAGDGGLVPGQLVFASELARVSGRSLEVLREELSGGRSPVAQTIGGPSLVALATAGQLGHGWLTASFFGGRGDDQTGRAMANLLAKLPLDLSGWLPLPGATPGTVVLSDPTYDNGAGERCFVNTIGAADNYQPSHLPTTFFDADIRLFGATALTPRLHDHLDELLLRTPQHGINVVSTVYDFRNERRAPEKPWPLLQDPAARQRAHLLIVDAEEARRIAGAPASESAESACRRLAGCGYPAIVVTDGPRPVSVAIGADSVFGSPTNANIPITPVTNASGDTTGCGDNFVGGILYALAKQLKEYSNPEGDHASGGQRGRVPLGTPVLGLANRSSSPKATKTDSPSLKWGSNGVLAPLGRRRQSLSAFEHSLDLLEAVSWGIAAGGATCHHFGGVAIGTDAEEKLNRIREAAQA